MRVLVALLFLLGPASLAAAPPKNGSGVPRLIFPVVGPVAYTDDFGDPRGRLPHQGNDLVAAKRQLVVAVEDGTVGFWTTSASAGCMLYLHGASGTSYQYIHLNNDLTAANDNRGRCVAGVSYFKGLEDGRHVLAGQPIGYVGDSGDANGIHPHLHFEVHPRDGKAVSPFPFLARAQHLLFAAQPGSSVRVALTGMVAAIDDGEIQLHVQSLRVSTGLRVGGVDRVVNLILDPLLDPSTVLAGGRARVTSVADELSLEQELGAPGSLVATSAVPLS